MQSWLRRPTRFVAQLQDWHNAVGSSLHFLTITDADCTSSLLKFIATPPYLHQLSTRKFNIDFLPFFIPIGILPCWPGAFRLQLALQRKRSNSRKILGHGLVGLIQFSPTHTQSHSQHRLNIGFGGFLSLPSVLSAAAAAGRIQPWKVLNTHLKPMPRTSRLQVSH